MLHWKAMSVVKDKKIVEFLTSWRALEEVLPSKESLLRALLSGRRLRFYTGIDPTSPDLHLGHAASLFFLRDMQRLGHEIILLIGDFTAQIGDPTGKDASRQPMTREEARANARTYVRQISSLLDFRGKRNPARVAFNSRWFSRLTLGEWIRLASHVTVQQLLERDMFVRRQAAGSPIGLHEFVYPVLQGYDSVVLDVDAEVGGNDQLFNMSVGRKLLAELKGKEKFVITTKLLVNPRTGKKMSKSEGAYVALSLSPAEIYGAVMALPDEVIWDVFSLSTDVSDKEVHSLRRSVESERVSYRDAKATLARAIVKWVHGELAVANAEKAFERVFVQKLPPGKLKTVKFRRGARVDICDFLVREGLAKSRSDAQRLIKGGALRIGGTTVREWRTPVVLDTHTVVQLGKRRFLKIIVT
ncbi:MAG: tyrosine--tRNA ligase [Parcubacteria group bacterium]|nr:tyrosine--tRNA ligase [Parcubacteria group bacterium]